MMKPATRSAFAALLARSREARLQGDLDAAFAALERAHVLGQRYLFPHLLTHFLMLRIGLQRRDRREVAGQALRLVASVPGYLVGWIPKGNTGGANVSALRPMPIGDELRGLVEDFSVWRDVATRLVLYGTAAAVLLVLR